VVLNKREMDSPIACAMSVTTSFHLRPSALVAAARSRFDMSTTLDPVEKSANSTTPPLP
jgi:hypothetical protein